MKPTINFLMVHLSCIQPHINMQSFPVLGVVISHVYLAVGVFPDHISFPCLMAALLGPTTVISDSI